MTTAKKKQHADGTIILTREEAALIRQVLTDCTGIFEQLKQAGGLAFQAELLSRPVDQDH